MYPQAQPAPRIPRAADLDLYRKLIERHGSGNSAALRYADKVIGRVQGHSGGPSLHEMRVKWEATHPLGLSGRTFRPDDFAFALAAQLWGKQADERCAALGLHPQWLSCVNHRLDSDFLELKQQAVNAQVFTREMLGALIRAQLPGKLCEAATPLEWQRIVNTALRLPDWVLDPTTASSEAAQAPATEAARKAAAATAVAPEQEPVAIPTYEPATQPASLQTASVAMPTVPSPQGGLDSPPFAQACPPHG